MNLYRYKEMASIVLLSHEFEEESYLELKKNKHILSNPVSFLQVAVAIALYGRQPQSFLWQ